MTQVTMTEQEEINAIAHKLLHEIVMDHLKKNEPSTKGMYLGLEIFHDIIIKNIHEDVFHIFIYKKKSDVGSYITTPHGHKISPCKYVSIPREKFNTDMNASYPFNTGILRMAVLYEKDSLLMVGSEPKEDLSKTCFPSKMFMECDHPHGCSVCGQPSKHKCSGCHAMYYCSQSCQQQGWSTGHKQCCKELQRSNTDTMVCIVAKTYNVRLSPLWI